MSAPDDLDWYLDNVVVPGGERGRRVGPAGAWAGWWSWQAGRLLATVGPTTRASERAARQGFVLAVDQCADAGVGPAERRRLLRRGTWWSCATGVVCVVPRGDLGTSPSLIRRRVHAVRSAAAAARRPGHAIGGASALVLHGLPTARVPDAVELTTPGPMSTGRRAGVHGGVHLRVPPPGAVFDSWFGVPVLAVLDAVADTSRRDAASGLMAADAGLHEGLFTRADLDRVADGSAGRRGSRRARDVLRLASALCESPLESLVRLALHDDRFPAPEPQCEITGADGRTYRVDFLWRHARLVLEADGRGKYTNDELWREKSREVALMRAGFRVVRVRWRDATTGWPETARWLRELLAQTP